jgi:hypothetical protein
MPSSSQQTILSAFDQVSGGASSSAATNANQVLVDALGQASDAITAGTQATALNTQALADNSVSGSSKPGGATVSDVLDTASQVLGGGLSLMPLVSLLSSLFGGQAGQSTTLVPFSLPPALNLQSNISGQEVGWGENGLPRQTGSDAATGGQQITVQVQAMDSQSFLDHSDDIAQAVRQAMLNLSSINDTISNL